MMTASAWARSGETLAARTRAGISAVAVISICIISATLARTAVPMMKTVERSMPALTSESLFFAPTSERKEANQRITKPP